MINNTTQLNEWPAKPVNGVAQIHQNNNNQAAIVHQQKAGEGEQGSEIRPLKKGGRPDPDDPDGHKKQTQAIELD